MSLIGNLPRPQIIDHFDEKGRWVMHPISKLTQSWLAWFSAAQKILQSIGNSGTTSHRPTHNLYVGQQYFDTSLGYPVWVKSIDPIVWVQYDGTVV